ncbi:MAG: alpha-amylase family glycosyl hydrolase [Ferruginibacter sp.]
MKRKSTRLYLLIFILVTTYTHAQIVAVPAWSLQSNIYEVNLRQYSSSGSIKDFQKHLPRLRKMGVEILWFMPITPIGIEGRKMNVDELGSYYAVRNYKAVNEEFGTLADWKTLVTQAHSLGFKVITDWVPNHSAPDNPWIKNHPDFYAKDSLGNMIAPFDWTDVRKLNYANRELRDSMIDAMKFWLVETGTDGFRCDVAGEVPNDFWQECITALKKVKNVYMLAEGESPQLHDAGFNTTYGWSMMTAMTDLYAGKKNLAQFDSAVNKGIADYPGNASRLFFTTNHDENSWNGTEFEKYGDAFKTFAVFTQTMYQSIPLVYSGQELPNKKRLKFFVRDTIEWNGNYTMAPFYATLLHTRRNNRALASNASYEKITTGNDDNIFAFVRSAAKNKVVVVLNFSSLPQTFQLSHTLLKKGTGIFTGKKESLTTINKKTLPPWGYLVYKVK